jgi:hypothetical protein
MLRDADGMLCGKPPPFFNVLSGLCEFDTPPISDNVPSQAQKNQGIKNKSQHGGH